MLVKIRKSYLYFYNDPISPDRNFSRIFSI